MEGGVKAVGWRRLREQASGQRGPAQTVGVRTPVGPARFGEWKKEEEEAGRRVE